LERKAAVGGATAPVAAPIDRRISPRCAVGGKRNSGLSDGKAAWIGSADALCCGGVPFVILNGISSVA